MKFNLEQALVDWKRDLLRRPGFEPGVVEELESHLRDRIDDLTTEGMDPETAFRTAVASSIGEPDTLAEQYLTASEPQTGAFRSIARTVQALFPNYFRVALRKFSRRRGYALMNVVGLGVALASAFLILTFVADELRFDRFHPERDRLFRVEAAINGVDGVTHLSRTPGTLAPLIDDVEAAVHSTVRFIDLGTQSIRRGDEIFNVDGAMYVDSTFFDIFGFRITQGNASNPLRAPDAAVVTRSAALKLFGTEDAVGEIMTFNMTGIDTDFRVEAIAEDPPQHSHIRFDVLFPFAFWDSLLPEQRTGFDNWVMNWENNRVVTYTRLEPDADPVQVAENLSEHVGRHVDERQGDRVSYTLTPISDVYLYSPLVNELGGPEGDARYIWLLSALGVLILLIAGINFVNLATAQASDRALESGVRKAIGARRGELMIQYLGESLLLAFAAGVVAATAASLLLEPFGALTGKPLTASLDGMWQLYLTIPLAALIVGIAAGLYPAILLSGFRPSDVLRGTGGTSSRGSAWLRRSLVVSQFAAAAFLFAATLTIDRQLDHFLDADLGYSREQVVMLPIDGSDLGRRTELLKKELLDVPGVNNASILSYAPGQSDAEQSNAYPFRIDGLDEGEEPLMWDLMPVDTDFLTTLRMELVDGRFFSEEFPSDSTTAFVVNEAAARHLGEGSAVGERLDWYMPGPEGLSLQASGRIVGVVRDFHTYSLHSPIQPTVMVLPVMDWFKAHIALSVSALDIESTLSDAEETWSTVLPGAPFEYSFLDDDYDRLYRAERTTARVFALMTIMALLVACIGLVGLSSYVASRRTKEVGIRKVLGADTRDVAARLMTGFLGLVATGVLLAIPLTWIAMTVWLNRFAYRVAVSPVTFVVVAVVSLLIAGGVVSYHTLRVARSNPADCLRSE